MVACRPIRLGRLTVPPAPGMSPRWTSGREMRADGAATTRWAKAASSIPEPTVAPWMRTVVLSATSAMARPAFRCKRTRWPVTGSGRDPNSSRSPPLQNESPVPAITTEVIEGSSGGDPEGGQQLVSHGRIEGVVARGDG